MNKLIVLLAVVLLAGCATAHKKTLEYCETDTVRFLGLQIKVAEDCVGFGTSSEGREPPGAVTP